MVEVKRSWVDSSLSLRDSGRNEGERDGQKLFAKTVRD